MPDFLPKEEYGEGLGQRDFESRDRISGSNCIQDDLTTRIIDSFEVDSLRLREAFQAIQLVAFSVGFGSSSSSSGLAPLT